MSFLPLTYTCERSIEVYKNSESFLQNSTYAEKLTQLTWAYHDVGDVIPHTEESFWSGHFFPWLESWEEMQISINLALFGLYKQAMVALRSGLELGLLSVYWNLNDDGHITISNWLKSEEKTPYRNEIWKRLAKHNNFREFQSKYDIKTRIDNLDYLHNYVHTKGIKFSNQFGLFKSNFQTFEESAFQVWFAGFEEIIQVLCILHLIKYPIGVIKYNYNSKFGIDTPAFGGLDTYEIERIETVIGKETFSLIEEIAEEDINVSNIMEWIEALPDITEEEVEAQIVKWDMLMIEQNGLESWLEQENDSIENIKKALGDQYIEDHARKARIEMLIYWANQNNFLKSKRDRN